MMRKLFTLRKNIFRRASEDEQDMENLANSSESNSGKLEDKASTPKVRGVSFTPSHFLNVSPVVLSLLQHLNDEEWDRIEESMHSSMTRSRFTTLCTDIVGWVSEAATRIILPALALVLDVTITESSSSSPISSKLARRSSSKESCDEKTTTSIFNAEAETPVSGAERTASNIVDIVLHWISEDVEQISPAAPRMCKSGSDLRFDMLLSKENIQMLSPQLVGRVHRLIMEDNSALPVITLAARRVNSDSAVSKGRGGRLELAREAFSELVYIFTEKCVRKLLQECLYCLPHPPHSDNFEDVVCTTPVTSSSLVQVMPSLPFQSDISAIPSGQSPKKISTTSASSSTLIQVMPSPASQNEFSNLHVGQSTQKASKPSLELSSPSIESLITVMAQEVMKLLPEKIDDCNQVWEFLETKDICESTPLSSAVKYSGVNNTKATNHRSSSGSKVEVDPISGSEAGLKNGKKF
ncbi:transmembrane protein 101 isoform X2 [Scleropages formosus]|uniref:transmembrane protein 101 isoform X2 n=1 Tax=Scleropages formosus TaxID=113540 RepID=UPI0008782AE7|nr:transmembrane protein 101 isoform X2 [Scleropages formosus]